MKCDEVKAIQVKDKVTAENIIVADKQKLLLSCQSFSEGAIFRPDLTLLRDILEDWFICIYCCNQGFEPEVVRIFAVVRTIRKFIYCASLHCNTLQQGF